MLNTPSHGVYRFNQYTVECKLCTAPNPTLKTLSYALQFFVFFVLLLQNYLILCSTFCCAFYHFEVV